MFMPGVWILWSKKKNFVIIFQKENGNTFTLFIIFVVKSLQKEQNSTNPLLWSPICRNKSAITPKWFNSLDTNSTLSVFLTIQPRHNFFQPIRQQFFLNYFPPSLFKNVDVISERPLLWKAKFILLVIW